VGTSLQDHNSWLEVNAFDHKASVRLALGDLFLISRTDHKVKMASLFSSPLKPETHQFDCFFLCCTLKNQWIENA
jgi:hypothetical protein